MAEWNEKCRMQNEECRMTEKKTKSLSVRPHSLGCDLIAVIPAKAGIQYCLPNYRPGNFLDSRAYSAGAKPPGCEGWIKSGMTSFLKRHYLYLSMLPEL
jgi:hypothetical protein